MPEMYISKNFNKKPKIGFYRLTTQNCGVHRKYYYEYLMSQNNNFCQLHIYGKFPYFLFSTQKEVKYVFNMRC